MRHGKIGTAQGTKVRNSESEIFQINAHAQHNEPAHFGYDIREFNGDFTDFTKDFKISTEISRISRKISGISRISRKISGFHGFHERFQDFNGDFTDFTKDFRDFTDFTKDFRDFTDFTKDFRISTEISGFRERFQISREISGKVYEISVSGGPLARGGVYLSTEPVSRRLAASAGKPDCTSAFLRCAGQLVAKGKRKRRAAARSTRGRVENKGGARPLVLTYIHACSHR